MMTDIEPIIRRKFPQADRAAVQEKVCLAVEADPERFLAAYCLDSRSFQGRYVNSDLMKEMFSEYNASKEHRNRYNLPVHNAAAVLAGIIVVELTGWDAISLLESEGNHEYIKQRLTHFLKVQFAAKFVTAAAYQQAIGQTAPGFY